MKLYQFIVMLSLVFTSGLFISCEDDLTEKIYLPNNPTVSPLYGSTWRSSFEGVTYYIRFTKAERYHNCYFCKTSKLTILDYYSIISDYNFEQMQHDCYPYWERDANTISFGSPLSLDYHYGTNGSAIMEYILNKAVFNEEENSMDLYGREKSSDDEKLLMTMSRVRQ